MVAGLFVAALLAVLAIIWTQPPRLARRTGPRLATRLLVAAALGVAVLGPTVAGEGRPRRVELVDISASYRPRRAEAEARLAAARRAAEEAGVETVRIPFANGLGEKAETDATDLAGALLAALAAVPSEVLLASDGVATFPGSLAAAERLAARGVPVTALHPPTPQGRSLAIASVRAPERVRPGEAFTVEVGVAWSGPGAIDARLVGPAGATPLLLPAEGGLSLVALSTRAPAAGAADVPLRLEPRLEDDLVPEDEEARALALVASEGSILLIAPQDATPPAGPFADRLSSAVRVAPGSVASSPNVLLSYDVVVLLEAHADALGERAQAAIAAYVESGGGLLVLGARRAFGAGGYSGAPLERVLPVLSELPPSGERLGLVIAIDRSGSMGEPASPGTTKYSAALDALGEALARLSPEDQVGAIVFARSPEEVRPPGPLGDPLRLIGVLAARSTGGETDVFPALRAAIEAARGIAAERRHVLLLSDGRSEATPDAAAALAALSIPADVTVAVVALGRDADRALLGAIAAKGRGRFSEAAAGAGRLADVLAREVDPRRPPPVVEGPVIAGGGSLSAMARVAARPGARVLEAVPPVGPLTVEGEAGAGAVLAYASDDLAPRAEMLATAVGRIARPAARPGYTITLREEGATLVVEATAPTSAALVAQITSVEVSRPDGAAAPIPGALAGGLRWSEARLALEEAAPRLFRVRTPLPALSAGVGVHSAEHRAPLAWAMYVAARPREHVPAPPDTPLLRAIAETTGGRLLAPGEGFPPPRIEGAAGRVLVGHLAALAALALLAIDMALGAGVARRKTLDTTAGVR